MAETLTKSSESFLSAGSSQAPERTAWVVMGQTPLYCPSARGEPPAPPHGAFSR